MVHVGVLRLAGKSFAGDHWDRGQGGGRGRRLNSIVVAGSTVFTPELVVVRSIVGSLASRVEAVIRGGGSRGGGGAEGGAAVVPIDATRGLVEGAGKLYRAIARIWQTSVLGKCRERINIVCTGAARIISIFPTT